MTILVSLLFVLLPLAEDLNCSSEQHDNDHDVDDDKKFL